jgi:hypothetical protein
VGSEGWGRRRRGWRRGKEEGGEGSTYIVPILSTSIFDQSIIHEGTLRIIFVHP